MTAAVTDVLRRARGTFVIVKTLPRQGRVPYLPPEVRRRQQDASVRAVVRYAAERVPYYRALFRERGIDPREIRTGGDLASLPMLEKREVQADPQSFRADSRRGRDGIVMRTAGSTGEPLEVFWDRVSLLASIAYSERERAVETHFAGARYGYTVAQVGNPVGNLVRVRELYDRASFRPLRPHFHQLSIADAPETIVDQLNRIRPLVVRGFGTHLELVFRTAAARGLDLHRPKVVLYGADHMSDDGRRLIEERFGVPVLSRYSASEALRIGYFCEERSGFHVHEDLTHLRVVRPDGTNAEPGERGEVMVTDLLNRGSVLLNYRLGDLAALVPGECPCGRTTQRLSALAGRVREIIELADGDVVHPHLLETAIRSAGSVLRFQVVQRERDHFHVCVVTADQAAYDRIADEIATRLRTILHGASVTVERRAELRAERGTKFLSVISLPRAQGLAAPSPDARAGDNRGR